MDPVIPPHWTHYVLRYRYGTSVYQVTVENPEKVARGVVSVALDGRTLPEKWVPLTDDGALHSVRVELGNLPEGEENETMRNQHPQAVGSLPGAE
jgi:cyclic beta-1,2-glucan synthetase